MPTELEFKSVLRINDDLLHELLSFDSDNIYLIHQGYLNIDPVVRIRSQIPSRELNGLYFLTTKVKTPLRLIEIEQVIDQRDGQELFELCHNKLSKVRFKIYDNYSNDGIELDCFYEWLPSAEWPYVGDIPYFIMAEMEVPEGSTRPALPNFLQKHILYEVPLTDNRFSNTNLGDVEYTKRLYENLLKEE